MEVGVRELKIHLSRYLTQVRQGETVIVTDRGTPVARLERVQSSEPPAPIRRLAGAGLLVSKSPPRHFAPPVRMLPGEKTSTDYLAEQRR